MNSRPHILITNDDGIQAPGIKHLYHSLQDFADLTVIAPASEQSAVSLSITIRQPLRLERSNQFGQASAWSVTGTPADCVKLGLSSVLQQPPTLIVSGINRGSNAGRNLLYSGTVAGIIEGVMHDIPGVAFSCQDEQEPDYRMAGQYIPLILEHVLEHPLPYGTLLNVNFPTKDLPIKGFKMTRQGRGLWIESPEKRQHPGEYHEYYWLGRKLATFEENGDSDIHWLAEGYITAVPVHVGELTDYQQIGQRKEQFEKLFCR